MQCDTGHLIPLDWVNIVRLKSTSDGKTGEMNEKTGKRKSSGITTNSSEVVTPRPDSL